MIDSDGLDINYYLESCWYSSLVGLLVDFQVEEEDILLQEQKRQRWRKELWKEIKVKSLMISKMFLGFCSILN